MRLIKNIGTDRVLDHVSELTKERLRRVGKELRARKPMFAGDIGFRVFELDSSNIRAWNPNPEDLQTTVEEDSAFADDVAKTNLAAALIQHGLDNVRSI